MPLPSLNIHTVPMEYEGILYPEFPNIIGQYDEGLSWVGIYRLLPESLTFRAREYLIQKGRLYPYERIGYPKYYEDRVVYRRYTYDSLILHFRRSMLECIKDGFRTLQCKKMVRFISTRQSLYLPPDICQRIKEYLLPVPRNRAYH